MTQVLHLLDADPDHYTSNVIVSWFPIKLEHEDRMPGEAYASLLFVWKNLGSFIGVKIPKAVWWATTGLSFMPSSCPHLPIHCLGSGRRGSKQIVGVWIYSIAGWQGRPLIWLSSKRPDKKRGTDFESYPTVFVLLAAQACATNKSRTKCRYYI